MRFYFRTAKIKNKKSVRIRYFSFSVKEVLAYHTTRIYIYYFKARVCRVNDVHSSQKQYIILHSTRAVPCARTAYIPLPLFATTCIYILYVYIRSPRHFISKVRNRRFFTFAVYAFENQCEYINTRWIFWFSSSRHTPAGVCNERRREYAPTRDFRGHLLTIYRHLTSRSRRAARLRRKIPRSSRLFVFFPSSDVCFNDKTDRPHGGDKRV